MIDSFSNKNNNLCNLDQYCAIFLLRSVWVTIAMPDGLHIRFYI